MSARHSIPSDRRPRGFTLVELLTSIAIIAIITGITVIAFAVVAKDARISLARNTVTASLDNGRNLAIKNRQIVLVVFRQRRRGEEQYVEILTTRWSGDTYQNPTDGSDHQVDRFVPIADATTRELPRGIGIAAPEYGLSSAADFRWVTQGDLDKGEALAQLPQGWTEAAGAVIGVMYGRDGTVITRNTKSDSDFAFVDFNDDQLQQWRDEQSDDIVSYTNGEPLPPDPPANVDTGWPVWEATRAWMQTHEEDERFISLAPFLAVYDRDEAQEHRVGDWSNTVSYQQELLGLPDGSGNATGYISLYSERIHFNRFTGVIMR